MGELLNRIEIELNKNGKTISDNYKNNTLDFYNSYKTSSKEILNMPVSKMQLGGFYFIHYQDNSNWMKYSPIFVADFKKFDNLIIIYAINFNFIPLEVRAAIFDKFMTKDDFDNDKLLAVSYNGVYNALLNFGYEYALVEYNLKQVKLVHKIDTSLVPKFLYSGHPINKYDPTKLYSIWKKKLETRDKRHQEMMTSVVSDFYELEKELSKDYDNLIEHIDRVRKNFEKYG